MTRDSVLQLRYIGVFPHSGHREYKFHIAAADTEGREVSLTINNSLFGANKLMFQEACDLCYQKLLMDLGNESQGVLILRRAAISASDIDSYRKGHPIRSSRKATRDHHVG